MKLYVVLVATIFCLTVAYSNVINTNNIVVRDSRCPIDENEESDIVLLPHEKDCRLFYACAQGQLIQQECKDDLFFNPEINVSNDFFLLYINKKKTNSLRSAFAIERCDC